MNRRGSRAQRQQSARIADDGAVIVRSRTVVGRSLCWLAAAGLLLMGSAAPSLGQIVDAEIRFTQAPPSLFSTTSYPIGVFMEGTSGGMECGEGGDFCWLYDYTVDPSTFAFTVNGVSQRSAFGTPTRTFHRCDYDLGEYGTDWECVDDYQVSGTATLTNGVTNTLIASVVREGNSAPVTESARVVTNPAASYAVSVTPDGENRALSSSGTTSTAFWVDNLSNVQTPFQITASCSGAAFSGPCTASAIPSYWLVDGKFPASYEYGHKIQVGVVYTSSGLGGATGTITLIASGQATDTGTVAATISYRAAVQVTRVSGATSGLVGSAGSQTFSVANSGNATEEFTLSASCSGTGLQAGTCAAAQSVTVPRNEARTVTVSYRHATTVGAGTISLTATSGNVPSVSHTASVSVSTYYLGVTVAPQGATNGATVSGPTTGARTQLFTVKNTSSVARTFNIGVTCSGIGLSSCARSSTTPASISLTAGGTFTAGATYTVGDGQTTGTLTLQAASGGGVTASGNVVVSVPAFGSVAVAPISAPLQGVQGSPGSASFRVTNTGNMTTTFAFTSNCPSATWAEPGSCSTPAAVTLARGVVDTVTVGFTYRSGGGSGPLTLVASSSSPTATGQATVQMLSARYAVTVKEHLPDGTATQFDVTNTGNASGTFVLRATCSGKYVVPESCATDTPITLAANEVRPVAVTYSRSSIRSTDFVLTLRAEHETDATVFAADTVTGTVLMPSSYTDIPPPEVTISPRYGLFATKDTVTLQVDICMDESHPDIPEERLLLVNGVNRIDDFTTSSDGGTQHPECEQWDRLTGVINLDQERIEVEANLVTYYGYTASDEVEFGRPPLGHAVRVAAALGAAGYRPSTSGLQQRFTVTNTGDTAATYLLTARCEGFAAGGSCVPASAKVTVTPGQVAAAAVTFTTAATADAGGSITLIARDSAEAGIADSAWADIALRGPAPVIDVLAANPGVTIAKDQCLAFGIVPGVATECGVLRISHTLPAVQTFGQVRAPTLVYYFDQANQWANVAVHITKPTGAATPTSVRTTLYDRSSGTPVPVAQRTDAGSLWASAGNRVGLIWDGLGGGQSRILPYSVSVEFAQGGSWQRAAPDVDGELVVVRRALAPGWHVAGVEELYPGQYDGSILWVGGDGSTRKYTLDGANNAYDIYHTSAVTRPDSLLRNRATGTFVRRLPNGTEIYFDDLGRHVQTKNPIQKSTWFTYRTTTRQLDKIVVPPDTTGARGLAYTFHYSAAGYLDSISAPQARSNEPRMTRFTRSTAWPARIVAITDPDGAGVQLDQSEGVEFAWVNAYIDPRGTRTDLGKEDNAPTLASAVTRLGLGAEHDISQSFRTVTGLSTDQSYAPTPLDSVFVRYDGPRNDVADVTVFWLNRFGAPERILDALGRTTRIERTDARFPGLATATRSPGGLRTAALYNTYGLADSIVVQNPLGDGRDATTRYKWDRRWAKPTRIETPDSVVTEASYFSDHGNIYWTQTGGSTRRVHFGYHESALLNDMLLWVKTPVSDPVDVYLYYDGLANLSRTRSALGFTTLHFRDRLGRDTLTITAVDSASGRDSASVYRHGARTRTQYDAMGRVLETVQYGKADTVGTAGGGTRVIAADSVGVKTDYDEAGNPTAVTRWYVPEGETAKYLMQWFTDYDRAGRVIRKDEPGGAGTTRFGYDPAGNALYTVTARSDTIRSEYDALNRLLRRVIPATGYKPYTCTRFIQGVPCTFSFPTNMPAPDTGGVCIRADTSTFGYDAAGNLVKADNYAARVRRAYAPNGALLVDTLVTRGYYTEYLDQPCDPMPPQGDAARGPHVYATGYEYDLAGRRTKLLMPFGDEQRYAYDPLSGELVGVTAPSGDSVGFAYDAAGRLETTTYPNASGPITDVRHYDAGGRLYMRSVATFGDDVFSRDAMGRLLAVQVGSGEGTSYTASTWYGPLGAVVATENATWRWEPDGGQGLGGLEEFTTDPFGNRLHQSQVDVHPNAPDRDGERELTVVDGRLVSITAPPDPTHPSFRFEQGFEYDKSGNTWLTHTMRTEGLDESMRVVYDQTASYYDALNRLAVVNHHLGITQLSDDGGVYEEYRYDALGRRVLVRSRGLRREGARQGSSGVWSYVERTIWDGDRVLAEIRTNGATDASSSAMESDSPGSSASGGGDPFGRVRYVHAFGSAAAGGIDLPVLVERSSVDGSGTLVFAPLTNWRGQVQAAVETPSSGTIPRTVSWPGARVTLDGAPVSPPNDSYVWMGNLASQLSDGSGLQYRRNRYYDPATGRFTQPDPIGLAGGLNAYGFAGGDPVNYSDPFGLCVLAIPCPVPALGGFSAGGPAGWVAGAAVFTAMTLERWSGGQGYAGPRPGAAAAADATVVMARGGGLQPDADAVGPHSTAKRDPKTGKVTRWQEWVPPTDSRNPNPFEPGRRYDGQGQPHFNPKTGQRVPTPHVHDPATPGGVRPPKPEEIPPNE